MVVASLQTEVIQARHLAEIEKRENRIAALGSRLRRVAAENGLTVPESGEFLGDVMAAYEWLGTVGRADIHRKHSHTFWLDRMSVATRHNVSTQAFIAAAMCHGDIAIELGDHVTSIPANPRHRCR